MRQGVEFLPYIWAALGLVLIGAEFLLPSFMIFFFGAGALVTAALTAFIPGLRESLVPQVLVWLGASTATLFSLRHWLRGVFGGSVKRGGDEEDVAGKQATVVEAISPQRPGRVRFQGTTWEARSYEGSFTPGTAVQIVKNDNLALVVTRAFSDDMLDDGGGEEG
ncbi:MAG: NfeD family protein [Spirochaetaceae bacterium]|nr:NfeD family protein [Spirochaetaceae bacterium]